MKLHTWIVAVVLALALASAASNASGAAAQSAKGVRGGTSQVTSKGTKASPKPVAKKTVPESSLGSAGRRALLGGKAAASKAKTKDGKTVGKATDKPAKPKVRS